MAKKLAEYKDQIRKKMAEEKTKPRDERILIIVQAHDSMQKEMIRAAAKRVGESMSEFVLKAAENRVIAMKNGGTR